MIPGQHPLGVIIIVPFYLIQFPLPYIIPDKKSGHIRNDREIAEIFLGRGGRKN
jgi:hypothetical protein